MRGEPFTAELDYIAYSIDGAYGPDGRRLSPQFDVNDLQTVGVTGQGTLASFEANPEKVVPWTRIFNITTTTASRSLPEWKISNPAHAFIVSGKLAMASFGIGGSNITFSDPDLNNSSGTTLEVSMWLPRTALDDPESSVFSLQDGSREIKLSFFPNNIQLLD